MLWEHEVAGSIPAAPTILLPSQATTVAAVAAASGGTTA